MNTPSDTLSPAALLREVDMRMAQALENFFQRSGTVIHEAILRAITQQMTPSMLATGQTCLGWIDAYPDTLSTAFANQFRQHLIHPETLVQQHGHHPSELQLVDDTKLARLLAEEKAANQLTEALRPEMLLLFGRLQALRQAALEDAEQIDAYGPLSTMRALSQALDSLDIDSRSGTLMLQCATSPLRDTLRNTYTALNQYLGSQGVEAHTAAPVMPAPARERADSGIGQDILAHLQSVASRTDTNRPVVAFDHPNTAATGDVTPFPTLLPSFLGSLSNWQARQPRGAEAGTSAPVLVLRQLQQDARQTDAGSFDLAVLDAVADLFDFILDDPDISPHYKSEIAQLQIPVLRAALVSPDFFSDDSHPARQLIDLLGLFSRHFPEHAPSHLQALAQIEAACAHVMNNPDAEAFAQAHASLSGWLHDEHARSETELGAEITNLELIERQELGTLLALENLHDLTERYPAPESVLRRLEAAWVPYMASLYVDEAGEGPTWRAACMTLLQLFLSLQPPDSDETREARLKAIPQTNTELRRGLLSQGAEPAQLKDFFSAITATQEYWIRPAMGQQPAMVSTFVPKTVSREDIESLAQNIAPAQDDDILRQTRQLLEGDWVDFDPPFEGLSTARVAWVGVHGFMLFCDSTGEQRFSLDCDRLAAEIRAGRAQIPEQSLTRKAMLRLRSHLLAEAA